MKCRLSATCLALAVAASAGCQEEEEACRSLASHLGGLDITASRSVPAGCWLVDDHLYVSNRAVLTVEPGALMKFALGKGIEVQSDGALSALGTAAKPVVMTGQQSLRGYWNGVTITNSPSPDNKLAYVTVEYAGAKEMQDAGARSFRAAVSLDSSGFEVKASISNCTIRESSGYGLYLDAEASLGDFAGNTITKNASGAAYVYSSSVHGLAASSTYTGNDSELVFVNAAYEFGTQDRAWAALGVPYHVDGMFYLENQLTIAPGTTLAFAHGAGMVVQNFKAGITALGSADKPIVFTGIDKAPGAWNGLYLANTNDTGSTTPRTRLAYVTIEYGGGRSHSDSNADPFSGNLMLDSSGWNTVVEMSNSTIRNSSGYGIWLDCHATLTGTGNTYAGNPSGDTGREKDCN